jgi:hypothetical protein
LLLLLVFLLLKRQLLLRIVSRSRCPSGSSDSSRAHHSRVASESSSLLLLHLHLLLLHHLHHRWVHLALGKRAASRTVHATSTHHCLHLLHHRRVHLASHTSHSHRIRHTSLLSGNLLLHLRKVLLHTLPVLGHHSRAHARGTAHSSLLILVLLVVVSSVIVISVAKFVASTEFLVFFFPHVASRLSALHLNRFTKDLQRTLQCSIDSSVSIESNEAETTRTTSVLVHHKGRVDYSPKLLEEVLEIFFSGFLAHSAYEDLARALLLFTGYGSLRVDLGEIIRIANMDLRRWCTYDFAIQVVLLNHNRIDAFGIPKCQESEST